MKFKIKQPMKASDFLEKLSRFLNKKKVLPVTNLSFIKALQMVSPSKQKLYNCNQKLLFTLTPDCSPVRWRVGKIHRYFFSTSFLSL